VKAVSEYSKVSLNRGTLQSAINTKNRHEKVSMFSLQLYRFTCK